MKPEVKKSIVTLVLSSVLLIVAYTLDKTLEIPLWSKLLIYLVPYLIAGFDVLKEAVEGFKEHEFFGEEFLMSIATIGALAIGFIPGAEAKFVEAVFVMLFFKVGELFEEIAEGNGEKSIESLMEMRPDFANLVKDGKPEKVDPHLVNVGDIIEIHPGEKVPMDGMILEGSTSLNTVAITGESVPRHANEEDMVLSGSINLSGNIKVQVAKSFEESTASKIIELVENAEENKSKSTKFITKFAKVYTPIVCALAVILTIVPSLITKDFATWILRALTFLVVSCPCALVISVPLAYFGGIGGAAKRGIIIKGANHLEDLAKATTIVVDKTGTLTEGVFEVTAIHPKEFNEKELLHLASHAEYYSSHPIALSLKEAYHKVEGEEDHCTIADIEEIAGLGIKACVNGELVYVGNAKLMDSIGVSYENCHHHGTVVHVAKANEYIGHIVISDRIKEDSKEAISDFKKHKMQTIMLTGDTEKIAQGVKEELSLDSYFAELLPQDKVTKLEEILKTTEKGKVIFVGDGINDAPVLARADVGVAMGAMGSDAAIEAADVVLMEDKISKINTARRIAKKTQRIAIENIYFAIIVKVLVLILAAIGYAPMWLAVFADVGVTVLAVLNSMRTLRG